MLDLLESVTECRRANRGTVVLIPISLKLASTLSTPLRTTFIECKQLRTIVYAKQIFRKFLSKNWHLVDSLIAKHVRILPVDSTIGKEESRVETAEAPSVYPEAAPILTPPDTVSAPEFIDRPPAPVAKYLLLNFEGSGTQ